MGVEQGGGVAGEGGARHVDGRLKGFWHKLFATQSDQCECTCHKLSRSCFRRLWFFGCLTPFQRRFSQALLLTSSSLQAAAQCMLLLFRLGPKLLRWHTH